LLPGKGVEGDSVENCGLDEEPSSSVVAATVSVVGPSISSSSAARSKWSASSSTFDATGCGADNIPPPKLACCGRLADEPARFLNLLTRLAGIEENKVWSRAALAEILKKLP
jgi:hypothetical protein